jgi:two-component system chemotaxis sensor kinase CheA
MTDLAAEMLPIFRIETNERLDRIEATLLAVEAGNGDGDSIDSLFRDAHSIKGNAGMVGFDEAQRVARGMEDVLEIARESGVLESTLADSLLEAADSIRRAVRDEPAAVIAEPVNTGAERPSFHAGARGEGRSTRRCGRRNRPAPSAPGSAGR